MTDTLPLAKAATPPARGPSLETFGMTKAFGRFVALDDVSINVPAGTFHALLGENGAGKSTLVKCILGFYSPDKGEISLDGQQVKLTNPRDAQTHGVGMVYQHFTLVPSLTAAENLVVSRADAPNVINWRKERARLEAFLKTMPFRVPLDRPVGSLAAGEKQKLEILKLLYLDQRFLILDEPTSVLTPAEADEILGLLKAMAHRGEITALMITHKFREVEAFCDDVSVLRRGKKIGGGKVGQLSTREMASMMIGDAVVRPSAARTSAPREEKVLEIAGLSVENDEGRDAVDKFNLVVRAGEIVGIAGVSGNGQSQLVEALTGQRPIKSGQVLIHDKNFEPKRDHYDKFKVFGLPEEPLKNATAPTMSVAENMAFRHFDKAPYASMGWWLSPGPMRAKARELIARYKREDRFARRADPRSLGRQRAARGVGARAFRRRGRADRGEPLFRARFRLGRRHPRANRRAAQSRRGGASGVGGPRRSDGAFRQDRGDVGGPCRLSHRRPGRGSRGDRPPHGGTLSDV